MSIPASFALSILGTLLAAGIIVTRARRALRAAAEAMQALERRERRGFETIRSLLTASRRSSADVLAAFDRELRATDDRVDSVLVFVPDDDELRCAYVGGARVAHFKRLRLRRDDVRLLPAKASAIGCRASFPRDGAALLPTDRFAIAVPMIDAGRLSGVAYVSSVRDLEPPVGDTVARAVEYAGMPYAIALEREVDRADATYDGLTGLLGARAFRRRLKDEVDLCVAAERRRALGLWFVDTDSFKAVNDAFGHRAGDAVLQALAELLAAHLIVDLDVAGRNGGDEFCALLRDAGKGRAIARAQAFCEEVRAHDFGLPVPITASIGVATYPLDAATASEMLETPDAAMYFSKRSGRNRVSFVAQPGCYACVRSEAEQRLSRTSLQWRSKGDELSVERS